MSKRNKQTVQRLTEQLLKDSGISPGQIALFRVEFPDGMIVGTQNISRLNKKCGIDIFSLCDILQPGALSDLLPRLYKQGRETSELSRARAVHYSRLFDELFNEFSNRFLSVYDGDDGDDYYMELWNDFHAKMLTLANESDSDRGKLSAKQDTRWAALQADTLIKWWKS